MLRIREAIVVEGRYDKNTLSQVVDTVIIETGTDRAKLRVKRWAIGSVDTEHEESAEKEEKKEKTGKFKFKK